jgi:hypothetical protein
VDASVKDMAQVAAWLVASIGGTVAAFKAVAELRRANHERAEALAERQREFRWRQAEMARTILDQLWADPLARAAMKLLDWTGLTYTHEGQKTGPITHEAMAAALRTTNTTFGFDEQFVRDAFDQLFDGFERIEHYLAIKLVTFDDVRGRLEYYVNLLAQRKPTFDAFLKNYGFTLAGRLLARFPAWQTPNPALQM